MGTENLKSQRSQILEWAEQGAISPPNTWSALKAAGVIPSDPDWRTFIDRLLLVLGALCLALSLVFFIAYNWTDMGRWFRFSLVQTAVLLSVLAYWKIGANSLAGKLALLVACLALGVLLAYFGQTYQTGADTWQLFASWAVLMLPWALLGRFAPLWLLLLALLNLSLMLYFQVWQGIFWLYFGAEGMAWTLFLLNGAAWAAWEWASPRVTWMAARWWVRLIACGAGASITFAVLDAIWDEATFGMASWLGYTAWLAVVVRIYRRRIADLFILAGACLTLIVTVTSQAGHVLIDLSTWGLEFLVLNFLVVAMAAASAVWLKKVHEEHKQLESSR